MNKYLNYANYFTAFLLNEIDNADFIKNIILFGSVARGEATKESDVDMFIDIFEGTKSNKTRLNRKISNIAEKFYKSREFLLFKNNGIDNKINFIVDKIVNWKDLKESIESQGIVLYGKYSDNVSGKRKIVIYWNKVGKNRGAFLNQIYGFKTKGKRYDGLIDKFDGEKLGKSSLLLPIEHKKIIFDLIKKYKVSAKFKEIYEGS